MKMQLFKSHRDIFLSANIKNVVGHINAISEPGTLKSVEQLDRETLIRMDGRLFDLHDLNRYYQNKIHRHTGGLENIAKQPIVDIAIHRHTGGLEIYITIRP